MYSPDRIKRSPLGEGGLGDKREGLEGLPQSVSSADVWPPPFFTFEYFASLDNHRAQKDSSTADTRIYYIYVYVHTLCAKSKFLVGKPHGCSCAPWKCVIPRRVSRIAKDAFTIGLLGMQNWRWKGCSDYIYIYITLNCAICCPECVYT